MSIEETLRKIVREELALALAEHAESPRKERTHISATDLMVALGISRGTLNKMMAEGCPHVRPGNTPRFNLADVKAFLDAKGNGRP